MFRAPFDSLYPEQGADFVNQLLSEESLRRTDYFEPSAVDHWRQAVRTMRQGSSQRLSVEMGLAAVLSTQLWHHTFIDATLADLPAYTPAAQPVLA
jgi:asparagine synthase (glutamine-hydrolysing)